MLTLLPLPAFTDNYNWILHDERHAWGVDRGDDAVVLDYGNADQVHHSRG